MNDLNNLKDKLIFKLEQYRDLYYELAPELEDLDRLKKEVGKLALELGEGVEIDDASVSLRAGYERTSWDNGILTGLALVHPEINAAKKVSNVKPSAVVKVET